MTTEEQRAKWAAAKRRWAAANKHLVSAANKRWWATHPRRVLTDVQRARHAEGERRRRAAHPLTKEQLAARRARSAAMTKEQRVEKNRRERSKPGYLERRRAAVKRWRIRHLEKQREAEKSKRARRVARMTPTERKTWQRRYNRKAAYGLTQEAYDALFLKQGGLCMVCRDPLRDAGRGTHIDHDHVTRRVRGILCRECNLGLGHFRDSHERLSAAAAYLVSGR